MPRRLDTRILYTVEQKVFALGAWLDTDSIAHACHLFEQEYGFMLPRTTLVYWISIYKLNPPEE